MRSGTGTSLIAGVASALLILFCGLLGARKRMLRLRVGSVAAWAAAHNALGILALALALIHSRAHGGGLLTSLLLATLTLVVLGGMLGVAIQFVIPRFMTGRFQRESSHTEFALLFVEQWGRFHDSVVKVAGPQPRAEAALIAAERRVHRVVERKAPSAGTSLVTPAGLISSFYETRALPFLKDPHTYGQFATEASTSLAFNALRTRVGPTEQAALDELEDIFRDLRELLAERNYHRLLFGWQLVHIPLSIMVVLFTAAHILSAVYY